MAFGLQTRPEADHEMTAGLTIGGTQPTTALLSGDEKRPASSRSDLEPSLPSPALTQMSSNQEYDPSVGAKPYSPFYRHATSNVSVQQLTVEAKHSNRDGYSLNDPESGQIPSHDPSVDIGKKRQSKLWAEKKKKGGCLRSLNKKQRLAVKLVIAVLIVGTMIAIALGITAAVGGGVWKSRYQKSSMNK
ncbi:hypothetical protein ASPWEDRAFT_22932 [Aspergillus wentii DTO 134E9]|uniref:Uncharacterized protein n=1 Tax=Aspergillus wentii DTO 134E9 TaxID=1073089 RepID=A0A1L9S0V1_ASPWE|nr:uncharacterized protein ASPWEDRAFT_22932 [Aspergillus wentii DTO 134E9]KAI9931208.1 hypothetical protein MW887_010869 [Aspergillus wentii]OJJ40784.1 hypothetical protein ASPWEDRAFT_22932 [Aspergillus wentii DTO 134E9]